MALSPPTERMIRAAMVLQLAALEWDQAMSPNVHHTNAPPVKATIKAMELALRTLEEAYTTMRRTTNGAQG